MQATLVLRMSSRTYPLLVLYPCWLTCSSTKSLSDSGSEMFIVLIRASLQAWQTLAKRAR